MTIGTKSVLFGVHCFAIHPLFVARAWWHLYGFPFDPRLWFAFFLHDIGYIGKPNMDGDEGETHVLLGASLMGCLFGIKWQNFCLYHSRYYAKKVGAKPSRLCMADKLSFCLTPKWLYLPCAKATGELTEYLCRAKRRAAQNEKVNPSERSLVCSGEANAWHDGVNSYMRRWVEQHKDGADDTWTASRKEALNDAGVWK